MNQVLKIYPTVLKEHLDRWAWAKGGEKCFSVAGWDCKNKDDMSLAEYIAKRHSRSFASEPGYCNALLDTDLFILGITAEVFCINEIEPAVCKLSPKEKRQYFGFLKLGARFILSRLSETETKNFKGKKSTGISIEPGAWAQHPDYKLSGWRSNKTPPSGQDFRVPDISWDISHSRRFPQVLPSFVEANVLRKNIAQGLGRQLLYTVFNRDFDQPLFSNFFDGSNGCYRAKFSGGVLVSGYGPSQLSSAICTGGYLAWGQSNPDMRALANRIYDLTNSPKNLKFLKRYYEYPNQGASRDRWLLMFLPSVFLGATP